MEGGGATQSESELAGTPASYSAVRRARSFIHIHGFGCGKPLTELSRPCPWVSQSVSGGSASHLGVCTRWPRCASRRKGCRVPHPEAWLRWGLLLSCAKVARGEGAPLLAD